MPRRRARLVILLLATVTVAFADHATPCRAGDRSLLDAARTGDLATLKALLAAGADPNDFEDEYAPLMFAAERGDAEAVRLLLARGAKAGHHDHNGEFALEWAAKEGRVETARLLLDAGAKADELDRYERSALFAAAENGSAALVAL